MMTFVLSAAVTVSCSMSVDASVTQTRMRLTSTAHTSTRSSGRIQIEDGQALTLSFDAPETKQEILTIQYDFLL